MPEDVRNVIPIDYPETFAKLDTYLNAGGPEDRRSRYEDLVATMGDGDELTDSDIANMQAMFEELPDFDTLQDHVNRHIIGDEWYDEQADRFIRVRDAYRAAFQIGSGTGKRIVSIWNRTVDYASGTVIDAPHIIVVVINTPAGPYITMPAPAPANPLHELLGPLVEHQSGLAAPPA